MTEAEVGKSLSEGACFRLGQSCSNQAWYRPALETDIAGSFWWRDCRGSFPHQTFQITYFVCLYESSYYTGRAHTSTLLLLAFQTVYSCNAIYL